MDLKPQNYFAVLNKQMVLQSGVFSQLPVSTTPFGTFPQSLKNGKECSIVTVVQNSKVSSEATS